MKSFFLSRNFLWTLLLSGMAGFAFGQNTSDAGLPLKSADSLRQTGSDGVMKKVDSGSENATYTMRPGNRPTSLKRGVVLRSDYSGVLQRHPYFNFFGEPRSQVAVKREASGKDLVFYFLLALVAYFALVKLVFRKYFSNLFAVFFQVSLKQKQIREQLLQSPLPSLLMNIFFVICAGAYISFLLQHYQLTAITFWPLTLYSILGLIIIYLVKFLVLKLMGWIFNISDATDTYIFVVFLVNKLIGICLIPFLILLAFSDKVIVQILITASLTLIGILFGYRYLFSYSPVRKEIKVTQFHFLLYLCAFEVAPLLLIYKVLFKFFGKSF